VEKSLLDFDLRVLAPECTILSAITILMVLDLFMKSSSSRRWIGILSFVSVVAAGVFVLLGFHHPAYQILGDTFRIEPFSALFKLIILGGTGMVQLLSLSNGSAGMNRREGEYYYLLLAATLGAMVMVSSADLITLFVGLELLSLSSYVLVAIKRDDPLSNESGWKYVVLGGVSSAFILYGMSFLYGVAGTTNLFELNGRVVEALGGYPLFIYLSLFLMMVGFGFKITMAPFHMWSPDVYQGAPTPITAFLSVVSKTAALAMILRILFIVYTPLIQMGAWKEMVAPLLVIMAILSMVVGNTVALRQTNVKRMFAYSSIAQAGYLLVPTATFIVHIKFFMVQPNSLFIMLLSSTAFYLIAYLLMNLGAFAVINLVTKQEKNEEIRSFAGLYKKSPLLALSMTVFLISLAGLPVTAGFIGKFYLLSYGIAGQNYWLVGTMILTTIVSYYYYFGIVRQMFFRSPQTEEKITIPWATTAVIFICLIGTIGLGLAPEMLLKVLNGVDWFAAIHPSVNG
jgi:NADH-quinone oxidoreductase subunit N